MASVRIIPRIGQSQEAAQPGSGPLFDARATLSSTFAASNGIFRGDRPLGGTVMQVVERGRIPTSDVTRGSQTLLSLVGWAIERLSPQFDAEPHDSFGWASALGGAPLELFGEAVEGRATVYGNAQRLVRATRRVLHAAHQSYFCRHWTFTHGEAGPRTGERNRFGMQELRSGYGEMLDRILTLYGGMIAEHLRLSDASTALVTQVAGPAAQVQSIPDRFMAGVALAQCDVARRRDDVRLIGPTWDCTVIDNVHRGALGRMLEAEREALVRLTEEAGTRWTPFWGSSPARRLENFVHWRFALPPVPGARAILLDTSDRWAPTGASGFALCDGDRTLPVDLVELRDDGAATGVAHIVLTVPEDMDRVDAATVALDPPVVGWPDGRPFVRSALFCETAIESPFAQAGFDLPPRIRWPVVRDRAEILGEA